MDGFGRDKLLIGMKRKKKKKTKITKITLNKGYYVNELINSHKSILCLCAAMCENAIL